MTRGGSFKRAVRREARAAGVSYTQALARTQRDRDTVDRRVRAWRRWHRLDGLGDHFWRTYRVRVAAVTTLSAHGGGIFRVDLADRPTPWVARVVPPDARAADRLHEDVEILRLLERVGFPAEGCAHPEPVSSYRGQQVLVTGYVDGAPCPNTPDHVRRLADALGRLHVGKPNEDVRAALGYLDAVADRVQAVAAGRPPVGSERWWPDRRATDAIAERVVGRLTDGEPER